MKATCFLMTALLVLIPSHVLAQNDAMLTNRGSMLMLIPLAIMAAAIFGALIWKRQTHYEASLDIIRKRKNASECRVGFYERVAEEMKGKQTPL